MKRETFPGAASRLPSLYVHVPFCQSRCVYCGFYSTTRLALIEAYVEALAREMAARVATPVAALYIGGGTPSVLSPGQIGRLLAPVRLLEGGEATVEANPDDVTPEWVSGLRATPLNRVSLGLQTFDDGLLRLLRRRHTAAEARRAVGLLRRGGFARLSLDLIYGLPGQTLEMFSRDLDEALRLRVPHLSAYALMIEDGTPLQRMVERGEAGEAGEELFLRMYTLLRERLASEGYVQYEISNFALPGFEARHNSRYWTLEPYIGLGPGAHSYDGLRRRTWNRPDLAAYIRDPLSQQEGETLTDAQRLEERVFLALRTARGLDLGEVERDFGRPSALLLLEKARPWLESGKLRREDGRLFLTPASFFISDTIVSDLI